MLKKLKQRWEAEETAIGKKLKYYVGYVFMAAGWVTLHVNDITSLFTNSGLPIPLWLPKVFFSCGLLGYISGKMTKRSLPDQVS